MYRIKWDGWSTYLILGHDNYAKKYSNINGIYYHWCKKTEKYVRKWNEFGQYKSEKE